MRRNRSRYPPTPARRDRHRRASQSRGRHLESARHDRDGSSWTSYPHGYRSVPTHLTDRAPPLYTPASDRERDVRWGVMADGSRRRGIVLGAIAAVVITVIYVMLRQRNVPDL